MSKEVFIQDDNYLRRGCFESCPNAVLERKHPCSDCIPVYDKSENRNVSIARMETKKRDRPTSRHWGPWRNSQPHRLRSADYI